uniref:Specifically androgen-regulated gene protein n=1 Tax=Gasterosteus aculeatus TaxID=69293 RepID=G3NG01_GASAC
MPKSDTWPGGVAMEPLSNLDSAGSCDSVISVNSGYSQDSMEHLSPEERACLMFFEETIEALEVQEDSGLSNDEPDSVFPAGPEVNGVYSLTSNASKEDQTARPGTNVFSIKDQAEHHAPNHTSEPQSFPTAAANMNDLETPMHPVNPPKPPVTESTADCKVLPSASQPRAGPRPGVSDEASQIDVGVIPPPSDFMDQPVTPPRPQKVEELLPSTRISNEKPGAPVEQEPPKSTQGPPNEPPKLSLPAPSSCLLMSPPRSPEPRSPPAVAPKPKKLPTNIILKSHKAGVDVSKDHSEHLVHNSSDRLMPDPQRVRIEALRKLGLLPAEADPGPASPRSRSSWATPLSPIGLKPPLTPPYTCVNSSSPARVPSQSPAAAPPSATSTAPAGQPAAVMPAPPAFSDSVGPPLSGNEPRAAGGASEARVNARMSAPPHTSPAPVKHPTPSKVVRAKSATLERPGLGQSSYADGPDSTKAGQPHRNRVRQASLGGLKEFTGAGREAPAVGRTDGREPEFRRSLPAHHGPQAFGEASKKLPRSQGISVLICPRAENEGDRRQALKKLGLLRD